MKIKNPFIRFRFRFPELGLPLLGILLAGAAKPPLVVVNAGYRLQINSEKGTIESLRATYGASRELLIPEHGGLPLFKIEFLSGDLKFTTIDSSEAKTIRVTQNTQDDGETMVLNYEDIGNQAVGARVTIRCPRDEALTYWSLEVDNRTTMWIGHVQFPVVEVPFDRNPTDEGSSSYILSSLYDGVLVGPVEPKMVAGSWRRTRYDTPATWRNNNYPRDCTTQLMAYYNAEGGLYVACADPAGLPKLLAPMVENNGVVMGLGHFPGTRGPGKTKLSYEIVLGTFRGDWYAAAEIYRNWAEKQPFCARKLAQRPEVPKWLQQSLVGTTLPMRGQTDDDPAVALNPEYTPATNALPYLEKLAQAFDSPLMPTLFNWERAGPWVQPEAYPPVGGEASLREFMTKAKAKGWHPALYGNGLNWVTAQHNTGYDGMAYFRSHGGEGAVVHKWNGDLSVADNWRKYYTICVSTEAGRKMVVEMTRGMAELGPAIVQQFDQGVGAVACYATDHGHPPVPGPWMSEDFASLLKEDKAAARAANPAVVTSCEGAPPEIYLQDFELWDSRIGGGGRLSVPLYSFLYHEYLNGHAGSYLNSVNDEALRMASGRALVNGYIQNFTLRDKGQIEYEWDDYWKRAVPDQPGILDWAKRAIQFRSGIARDYLVFGKMLRPWRVAGVTERDYGYGREPLVQSATWKAPDGRIGVVLANIGDVGQNPRVELEGRGMSKVMVVNDDKSDTFEINLPGVIEVAMQPRSIGLVEIVNHSAATVKRP
ncbi:MAG: hypothetical protein JWM32_2074 [Verrucomicrobia bacterium]|nr:hypothetical protein [Verrucomicrobiota bacterium]